MNITIQMRVDSNDGDPSIVDIATIEREALSAASLGLSIAEGQAVLSQIQSTLTKHQLEGHIRTFCTPQPTHATIVCRLEPSAAVRKVAVRAARMHVGLAGGIAFVQLVAQKVVRRR